MNNYNTERIPSIKLLGVVLDENLSWKDHIKYTENKISKNIGILHKARDYLSKESLLSLYYAYIHTYINYSNLAWASTIKTNLKKIHSQQKYAISIIFRKDKFSQTKEIVVQNKVFNVYQLKSCIKLGMKLHQQYFYQFLKNQHTHTQLIFRN